MKTNLNRDELAHLLSLSGNLAGLSITGVTIFHTIGAPLAATVVDDILAITALLFLLCCYMSFFALRSNRTGVTAKLIVIADGLFLLALTLMVGSGFLMLYTLW